MEDKAIIIGGKHGEIIARQKSDAELEIGELLICENKNSKKKNETKILLQVNDILFGSQISKLNIEKISGFNIEGMSSTDFLNNNLRNYKLAIMNALVNIKNEKAQGAKDLPEFFSTLPEIEKGDLDFMGGTKNELFFGYLRSGTKKLEVPVVLDGEKVLSHHLLITGTTGRGKSVLMKNLIWSATAKDYASMLIFDPHDEYYGRKNLGMKDFPEAGKVIYYTPRNVPSGQRTLKINLELLRPDHFDFLELSSAQRQIMYLFYKKYGEKWISSLLKYDVELSSNSEVNEMSLAVLRRRIKILLDIDFENGTNNKIQSSGIFDETSGKTNIQDIINGLEQGKTIIIDTSTFSGSAELLVASMIATELFIKYKRYNMTGELQTKPVVNIVLEEAPRVIGKEILEQGPNIFSTLAREGRKFKIGLTAITQLPSLIPKEILANLNTKIIMGTEMNSERQAIIESASQDLSTQNRAIAGLDKGEAIVSSNFSVFAVPISIPYFDEEIKLKKEKNTTKNSFSGINLS